MKRFIMILFCSIGLSSIVFAGGRYTSLGKEKVAKETGFTKKDCDFVPVFVAPEQIVMGDVQVIHVIPADAKTVKQFDLVTNPRFNKHLLPILRE